MERIAELIGAVLAAPEDGAVRARVRADVRALAGEFPLYPATANRG
jgi:glycine/serine hydroxymethyltransferase